MKRLLTIILMLTVTFMLVIPSAALQGESSDVVHAAKALGVINVDDNSLTKPVTRADFCKMLVAASIYKDSIGSQFGYSLFFDVKSDHWASAYIKLAIDQEWLSGYLDGTFKPSQRISYEEAATATLKLLGFDKKSLPGAFPYAQLAKFSALGLNDGIGKSRGQDLTYIDCAHIFYNLMNTKNSGNTIYASTLGYPVKDDKLDYKSLVNTNISEPAVYYGKLKVPFSVENTTVYRNDSLSDLSSIQMYDVYYYNTSMNTMWVYSNKAVGTISDIKPNRFSPTSITVAGVEYAIATPIAGHRITSESSFSKGSIATLLLGMNGKVIDIIKNAEMTYYGVVKSVDKIAVTTNGNAESAISMQIICTDGISREFQTSKIFSRVGQTVCVKITNGGVKISPLSRKTLSGEFDDKGLKLGKYTLAEDIRILDISADGSHVLLYPSRLAGAEISSSQVHFFKLNEKNEIDQLILKNASGDNWLYGLMTKVDKKKTMISETEFTYNASFEYIINGQKNSFSVVNKFYGVEIGGFRITKKDGQISRMKNLKKLNLNYLSYQYGTSGTKKYLISEDVQVYLQTAGSYSQVKLNDVLNVNKYRYTAWYDDFGAGAGGRIRIITAIEK